MNTIVWGREIRRSASHQGEDSKPHESHKLKYFKDNNNVIAHRLKN
jgi:hypothetical protein